MSVLHVNIPAFPVAVERLADRKLRHRPVAIAASGSSRAPLLYVSPEAYAVGIRKGMPQREARRWERRLVCLTPEPRRYERAQKKLLEVISHFTPAFEPMRLGSIFLDMSGMELLFGKAAEAASTVRADILRHLELDPTLGVGRNKLVSRVAAKVMRPHGLYEVYPGHEAEFLQPLPVDYLPGVGRSTSGKLLRELRIRSIGELATIPVPLLVRFFGKAGIALHEAALGEDPTSVKHAHPGEWVAPSFVSPEPLHRRSEPDEFCFDRVFPEPTNNDQRLLAELWHCCERAGRELRRQREMASRSVLEGIYVDGQRIRQGITYPTPTQSDFDLFHPWEQRWRKWMERRLQLKSLTLTLRDLCPAFEQLDFTRDGREPRLLKALDEIRRRYGEQVLAFGRAWTR
jgi:DNA polymerase-4